MRLKLTAVVIGVLGMAFAGNAQWSRTSPNVYLTTSSDKVGIGITIPGDYKLAVNGSINTYTDLVLGSSSSTSWVIHSNQNGSPAGKLLTIAPSISGGGMSGRKILQYTAQPVMSA